MTQFNNWLVPIFEVIAILSDLLSVLLLLVWLGKPLGTLAKRIAGGLRRVFASIREREFSVRTIRIFFDRADYFVFRATSLMLALYGLWELIT